MCEIEIRISVALPPNWFVKTGELLRALLYTKVVILLYLEYLSELQRNPQIHHRPWKCGGAISELLNEKTHHKS